MNADVLHFNEHLKLALCFLWKHVLLAVKYDSKHTVRVQDRREGFRLHVRLRKWRASPLRRSVLAGCVSHWAHRGLRCALARHFSLCLQPFPFPLPSETLNSKWPSVHRARAVETADLCPRHLLTDVLRSHPKPWENQTLSIIYRMNGKALPVLCVPLKEPGKYQNCRTEPTTPVGQIIRALTCVCRINRTLDCAPSPSMCPMSPPSLSGKLLSVANTPRHAGMWTQWQAHGRLIHGTNPLNSVTWHSCIFKGKLTHWW